jgi:hypothetical protein
MNVRKIIKEEVNDFEWAGSVPSSDKLPTVSVDDFLSEYERVIEKHQNHMGWNISNFGGRFGGTTKWSSPILDMFYFEVYPEVDSISIEMTYDNPFDPYSENIKHISVPKFNYIEQIEPWINDTLLTDIHVTIMKWIDENQGDIENLME